MSESASRFHGKRLSDVPASDWPPITAEEWRAAVRFNVPLRRTLTGRVVRWARVSREFRGGIEVTTAQLDSIGRLWRCNVIDRNEPAYRGLSDRAAESRALAATR